MIIFARKNTATWCNWRCEKYKWFCTAFASICWKCSSSFIHCCNVTAVKSALNLTVLKGIVLIAFWVYLLGVCIDPVGVYCRAALPAARCYCTKKWKQSWWWKLWKKGWGWREQDLSFEKRIGSKKKDFCVFYLIYYLLGFLHIPTLLHHLP